MTPKPGEVWTIYGYSRTVLVVDYGCVTFRDHWGKEKIVILPQWEEWVAAGATRVEKEQDDE